MADVFELDLELPWIEKYRPQVVTDIVGNTGAVGRLVAIAKKGNMPNLILSGPPGTGKTTSILCLARALLGEAYKEAVLELNASDDRGIDVVREKIKMFAQKKVTLPKGRHKIILLDEADNITGAAQQALRRTMELHSDTTRFALACNYSTKIIEPIQSRCAILRFTRLADEQVLKRVKYVIDQEAVTYTEDGLDALLYTAEGDMRQALNNLQATAAGFGHLTPENLFKVCDEPHPVTLLQVIELCAQGKLSEADRKLKKLSFLGYSPADLISSLFRVVKSRSSLPQLLQLEFLKEIGFTHLRIAQGVSSSVQLSGLLANLCLAAARCKK